MRYVERPNMFPKSIFEETLVQMRGNCELEPQNEAYLQGFRLFGNEESKYRNA